MEKIAPSQIRKTILDEHQVIRVRLSELESEITKDQENPDLLNLIDGFMCLFLKHLQHEESILRPLLLGIDSWGPVRVESMDKDHQLQRTKIAHIRDLVARKQLDNLLIEVRVFVRELSVDMVAEEKEFLESELLRDDVVSTHVSGG